MEQDIFAIWRRIKKQLKRLAPEILTSLRPGASEAIIRQTEEWIPAELPQNIRDVYSVHDGQKNSLPLIDGWSLFSLKYMCYAWLIEKNDLGLPGSRYNSYFASPTQERYPSLWHPKWLPFMGHYMGPVYCIDLAPGPNGKMGQILFSNDRYNDYPDPVEPAPSIRVVAPNIQEFFATLANDLESGVYSLDADTRLLWSHRMLSDLPDAILNHLKQPQETSFSVDDTLDWATLNREHTHKNEPFTLFDDPPF